MFATSVRLRPCSARCRGSSLGRLTVSSPFASANEMSSLKVRFSSPFGPFTLTVLPSMVTVTPAGTATGLRPIRDMSCAPLPDEGDELAAEIGRPRLAVGHQTPRGRDDRHAEAVL